MTYTTARTLPTDNSLAVIAKPGETQWNAVESAGSITLTTKFLRIEIDPRSGAIDFQAQKAELAAKLPSDKGALVVAYCAGPTCGAYAAAAKAAQQLGYTNIKHLSAGISGWKDAGAPLEK